MAAAKSLLAHVLEATFAPYRHGGLLDRQALPVTPPDDPTRPEILERWGRLIELQAGYREAVRDREREAIAREFGAAVQRIAEVRRTATTLYEYVASVVGPHPRKDIQPTLAEDASTETGGARVGRFFETFLVHTRGRWAGQPFTLEPWQRRDLLDPLFEVAPATGLRLRAEGYWQISKKNGKSGLAAGIGAYLLCADEEPGAHVFSGAVDRDQARLVFRQAVEMVERSPLRPWVRVLRDAIEVPSHSCVWKVLSADALSDEGIDLHGAVLDELHHHEQRALYDLFSRSGLAREQPLVLSITNAPSDSDPDSSVCSEVRAQALAVLRGDPGARQDLAAHVPELDDEQLERAMAGDPAAMKAANPASWITPALLEQTRRRIRPAEFRRYNLNKPGKDDAAAWLPAGAWDACQGEVDIAPGEPVVVGCDFASRRDCAAIAEVCRKDDGRLHVRARVFAVAQEGRNPPAHVLLPGDRIPEGLFEETLLEIAREQEITLVIADPWRLSHTLEALRDLGLVVVEQAQTNAAMCQAAQALFDAIVGKQLVHDDDPVLRAHVRNAVAKDVGLRGWRLDRDKRRSPQDATIALAMAVYGLEAAPVEFFLV